MLTCFDDQGKLADVYMLNTFILQNLCFRVQKVRKKILNDIVIGSILGWASFLVKLRNKQFGECIAVIFFRITQQ